MDRVRSRQITPLDQQGKHMYKREDVAAFFRQVAMSGQPSLLDLEPADARMLVLAVKEMAELPAREVAHESLSIPVRDGSAIPARLYVPDAAADDTVIVYFHGGGWIVGSLETHGPLCSEICHASGFRVISVDYRLAPEHPFPVPVTDAIDAVRWIAGEGTFGGAPVRRMVLAGDSAGGALAAVAAGELRQSLPVEIAAQWLIYPALDISTQYPSATEFNGIYGWSDESLERYYHHYLGYGDIAALKRDPQVSPVFADDFENLPPALIFTGSVDPLRDQGRAYAAKLVRQGISTTLLETEQVHGSFCMRLALPSAQADLLVQVDALKALLHLSA